MEGINLNPFKKEKPPLTREQLAEAERHYHREQSGFFSPQETHLPKQNAISEASPEQKNFTRYGSAKRRALPKKSLRK